MISRIKHLQLAKLFPSTHVSNTKSATPNREGLGHRASKAFAIYPSDRARVSRQSIAIFFFFSFSFLFLFLFHFFFFFFFFFFYTGVLNLLKAVNETRVGYANYGRVHSFSAYHLNLMCFVCD